MIYLIITIVFVLMCLFINNSKTATSKQKAIIVGVVWFLLFVPISMFRGITVGTDVKTYYEGFKEIISGAPLIISHSWEVGYVWLNRFVGLFSASFNVLLAITSVATGLCVVYNIYKYSSSIALSLYLYVTLFYYYNSLNMVRQGIAIAISLFAYKYVLQRKFIKFMCIIILACLFHFTAISLIPIYFFANLKLSLKKMILLSGASISLLLLLKPLMYFLSGVFFRFRLYGSSVFFEGRSIKNIAIPLVVFIVALLLYETLLKINPYNRQLINIVFLALLVTCAQVSVGILERISHFYNIYAIFLLVEFVQCMKTTAQKRIMSAAIMAGTLVYNVYIFLQGFGEVLPYVFLRSGF